MPVAAMPPALFWPTVQALGAIATVEGVGQTSTNDHQVTLALIAAVASVLAVLAGKVTFGRRRSKSEAVDAGTVVLSRDEYLELVRYKSRVEVLEEELARLTPQRRHRGSS